MTRVAVLAALCGALLAAPTSAAERARDLGVPFDGTPGPLNAITDVAGVTVGQVTLIEDLAGRPQGAHRRHRDPAARTRDAEHSGLRRLVRAERQRRDDRHDLARGSRPARRPGDAHQHAQRRRGARRGDRLAGARRRRGCIGLLVVAARRGRNLGRRPERHQRLSREAEHVDRALDTRDGRAGRRGQRRRRHRHDLPRLQVRHRHRVAPRRAEGGDYTVGVLVQANYGVRDTLRIAGVPVGQELPLKPRRCAPPRATRARSSSSWPPTRRCCRTS